VNEVLCYIQNNFGKHPKNAIRTALVGFYDDDEVGSAKQLLFKYAESLSNKPDRLPRYIHRTVNDNKRKLDCDDMLNMFACLDEAKVQLPLYAAVNLGRIPTVNPGDVDIYAIGSNVSNMATQIVNLSSALADLRDQVQSIVCVQDDVTNIRGQIQSVTNLKDDVNCLRAEVSAAFSSKRPQHELMSTNGTSSDTAMGQAAVFDTDISTDVTTAAPKDNSGTVNEASNWVTVASSYRPAQPKPKPALPPIRFKGSRPDVPLKSVPRDEILSAFVGRLHPDTTEEDLTKYLSSEGMKGIVCRKLVAKNGRKFNTAAFRVTCSPESRDIFYNEKSWPCGVELRDWVYYSK